MMQNFCLLIEQRAENINTFSNRAWLVLRKRGFVTIHSLENEFKSSGEECLRAEYCLKSRG